MSIVTVNASISYEVKIENGLLSRLGQELCALASGSVMVVTDSNVAPLYLRRAEASLREAGFCVYSVILPAGESSKNLRFYGEVLDALAKARLTRTDTVVALGGGVVGDLAGFAAATYLRGLRLVQIPTTLLATVDSSVGGKTAVDLPAGKNLVGAFHQPSLVLIDPELLQTLPVEIFRDGCAEVIKTAILFDPELFAYLQARGLDFDREFVITRCVSHKRDVVCRDEFDTGLRQLLNLGHTIGHAIEKCSAYAVSHGSAVAIGTALMSRSYAADAREIVQLLESFGLPTSTDFSASQLTEAALADKKRAGDTLTVVIPRAVGNCELQKIPVSRLEAMIKAGLTHG